MISSSPADAWLRAQDELWSGLAGSTVTRWVGMDENIAGDDESIFLDRGAPFRQLGALRLERGDGPALDFATAQNDDAFGLGLRIGGAGDFPQADGRRHSDLGDLPTGRVERLEVHLDDRDGWDRDVVEVQLTVAGRAILIVAAEVEPTWTEPRYRWGDESFFVFTDPAVADTVAWFDARRYTVVVIDGG